MYCEDWATQGVGLHKEIVLPKIAMPGGGFEGREVAIENKNTTF